MLASIAVCLGNAESLLCAVGCIRSVDFVACTAMSERPEYHSTGTLPSLGNVVPLTVR